LPLLFYLFSTNFHKSEKTWYLSLWTVLFLLLWFCSVIWSQVIRYFQCCLFWLELLWVFEVFSASICTLEQIFLPLQRGHQNMGKNSSGPAE
jgi:hypothetical protein